MPPEIGSCPLHHEFDGCISVAAKLENLDSRVPPSNFLLLFSILLFFSYIYLLIGAVDELINTLLEIKI